LREKPAPGKGAEFCRPPHQTLLPANHQMENVYESAIRKWQQQRHD
jgi:hypothetical protein